MQPLLPQADRSDKPPAKDTMDVFFFQNSGIHNSALHSKIVFSCFYHILPIIIRVYFHLQTRHAPRFCTKIEL